MNNELMNEVIPAAINQLNKSTITNEPTESTDKLMRAVVYGSELSCIGVSFIKTIKGLNPLVPLAVLGGALIVNKFLFDPPASSDDEYDTILIDSINKNNDD